MTATDTTAPRPHGDTRRPRGDTRALTPVSRVLRLCLHALFIGLLALAATRAVTDSAPRAGWVVAACAVLAAAYVAGALAPVVHRSARAGALWLAGLCAAWAGLLVVSPDGLWIAFPLYFLELHLLRLRWGVAAVAVTACAAIGGFLAHSRAVSPGAFLGPLLGGAVAVATVLGYQALYRESERRRELIEELITTRAELAAAERGAGILAERERLAREIHDTLAQGLSSIQLLLRAAERTLAEAAGAGAGTAGPAGAPGPVPATSPPPAAPDPTAAALAHIGQARRAAQENLAEARRFVRALTPPDLEHGSLPAALERLCTGAPGPRVRFSLSGAPRPLPTPYEVALLRIAQSALANVVRHAGAGRAEITLTFMDTSVTLDIVDDGKGFDPSRASSSAPSGGGGFGLPAMRSRAETLGGLFTVESSPGQGTAVAVTLPLPAEALS
ncbi:sensor histidine kinase [Streptomyces sp. ISL-43]|uniref:sensor histidine kinase n=1 Tax=Streptomyces sp. ISL-43 TaxID=2819183 RepID=UPI001BEB10E7|nr:sensor histidine kinase [Streptomyces sp. ISL-43]MBT2450635.1 sensor histidine kinase [Streptomyces sp. ISL-43]